MGLDIQQPPPSPSVLGFLGDENSSRRTNLNIWGNASNTPAGLFTSGKILEKPETYKDLFSSLKPTSEQFKVLVKLLGLPLAGLALGGLLTQSKSGATIGGLSGLTAGVLLSLSDPEFSQKLFGRQHGVAPLSQGHQGHPQPPSKQNLGGKAWDFVTGTKVPLWLASILAFLVWRNAAALRSLGTLVVKNPQAAKSVIGEAANKGLNKHLGSWFHRIIPYIGTSFKTQ